jgi:type I restriction enzyme S subunit
MTMWKEYKIKDIAEVVGGGTPSTSNPEFYNGDIPWLTPRDLTGYSKKLIARGERSITELGLDNSSARMVPKNTILLTSRAPIGYLAIAENPVSTNQGFKNLIIKPDKANFNYVYYLLKANMDYVKSMGSGTTFAEISASVVKELKFSLPDLPTQTAIAEILSSLDDKIELNNRINAELEALAQALFKRWFVDFEFPNENGQPYKSSGGKMVESELGEIPEGWEVFQLGEVCDLISGYPFKGHTLNKIGQFGLVTIKNVQDGQFVQKTENFIDELPANLPDTIRLNIGDILMSLTGNVGRVCFVTGANYVLNQRVVKINGLQAGSNPFCYYFFRQQWVKDVLISISKGTAQLNLSPIETKRLKFPFPRFIDDSFLQACANIFEMQNSLAIENNSLEQLRDSLLPKIISGEIELI